MNNISQISIFEYREIENQPIAYTEEGEVFYIVDLNNYEKMKYLGYDKANNALRYTRYSRGKKIYRIPLETDYRIFTPVARDSKKFKKKYKMRTEIERLNGRIDRDYMFNDHFIRGQKKMERRSLGPSSPFLFCFPLIFPIFLYFFILGA